MKALEFQKELADAKLRAIEIDKWIDNNNKIK
jgi:hypothetical protein